MLRPAGAAVAGAQRPGCNRLHARAHPDGAGPGR